MHKIINWIILAVVILVGFLLGAVKFGYYTYLETHGEWWVVTGAWVAIAIIAYVLWQKWHEPSDKDRRF